MMMKAELTLTSDAMVMVSPGPLSCPDCGGLMSVRDSGCWSARGGWGGASPGPGCHRWCELTASPGPGHRAPGASPGSHWSQGSTGRRPGGRGRPATSRGSGCSSSAGQWRRCWPRSGTACHCQHSEAWKQNYRMLENDREELLFRYTISKCTKFSEMSNARFHNLRECLSECWLASIIV